MAVLASDIMSLSREEYFRQAFFDARI
ncbi:hypothetical protein MESS2_430012 [Mesorhizobium metallidurans STM 2683]|uniref:Uncharacterized protein n=1 Tax=Mesorhizobium metallidurans STM 2683 TaxID=1297569 RepID=M5ESC5_9HYPH|nr:hypothetical protein MESS2_430012 [Mesorhizobium metallidurans STM 2683]